MADHPRAGAAHDDRRELEHVEPEQRRLRESGVGLAEAANGNHVAFAMRIQ